MITSGAFPVIGRIAQLPHDLLGSVPSSRHRDDPPSTHTSWATDSHHGWTYLTGSGQGRGIGSALINEAIARFTPFGITAIQVTTQGRNYAAQRTYQRCGFTTQAVGIWMHKWY